MHPIATATSITASGLPLIEDLLKRNDASQLPYEAMLRFYNREGGLFTGDQLATLLSDSIEQPISVVARWIVDRRVVCLSNGVQLLLPVFQFDLPRAAIRPEVEDAVRTMRDALDDWGIASWFASANAQLDGVAPAQAIRRGVASLDRAARWARVRHAN
jgi:hypothetical protein